MCAGELKTVESELTEEKERRVELEAKVADHESQSNKVTTKCKQLVDSMTKKLGEVDKKKVRDTVLGLSHTFTFLFLFVFSNAGSFIILNVFQL